MSPKDSKATRGLATVALLKVNFDAGLDHIQMFVPFVLDVINSRNATEVSLADIKSDLLARHGLDVPINTLETIVTRVTRRGFVRREGGRLLRNLTKPIDVDLISSRKVIEREHSAVARRFRDFAATRGVEVTADEDALALILGFLEQNHVSILLDPSPTNVIVGETLSRRETIAVAQFLQEVFRGEPELAGYLQRILEGLVLQNALLLRDISLAGRKFTNLEIFFDTGFLLRALGLTGAEAALAARETL